MKTVLLALHEARGKLYTARRAANESDDEGMAGEIDELIYFADRLIRALSKAQQDREMLRWP